MERGPLRLSSSYDHEDADARDQRDQHLELPRRLQAIVTWSDGLITPGRRWGHVIEENMRAADIILLLISKHFLASKFVREVEIPLAMEEAEPPAGASRSPCPLARAAGVPGLPRSAQRPG